MYRPNVCAIIFNEQKKILGCRRVGNDRHPDRPQYFQFIQGGIESTDKNIVEAALREIHEEVGLTSADVVFVQEVLPPSGDPKEFRYRLAPQSNLRLRHGYEGQQQRMVLWFAPSAVLQRVVLVPPPTMEGSPQQEFDHIEWMSFPELLAKGHPEKLGLFEKLAFLTPPMMEAFLSARHTPLDAAASPSPSAVRSTWTQEGRVPTHTEGGEGRAVHGENHRGGPTMKERGEFTAENGLEKSVSSLTRSSCSNSRSHM